jgi:Na+-translocating ferredoxin:NAD+ oxidoreductase RnfC subunit
MVPPGPPSRACLAAAHASAYVSVSQGLGPGSLTVRAGDRVVRGQRLGRVGAAFIISASRI